MKEPRPRMVLSQADKVTLAGFVGSILGNCFTAEETHELLAKALTAHFVHDCECTSCRDGWSAMRRR